jgi:hypothetical protein
MNRTTTLLLSLLLTTSLFAQQVPRLVTPGVGSTLGGEEILIKGDFGMWPPSVRFGNAFAPAAERIDPTTLRVITPPHPAGTVELWFFDYDMWIEMGLTFTFVEGFPEEAYERVLVPIFTAPVTGANGSDFRSSLSLLNASQSIVTVYGPSYRCQILCPTPPVPSVELGPREFADERALASTGAPGLFVYLPRPRRDDVVMQLRAFDISRETTNFGTEIPIVREDEMLLTPITLLGVPTDARFRNTLRIYASHGANVSIRIEGSGGIMIERTIALRPGVNIFDPAYAMFTDFPTDAGELRVTVALEPDFTLPPPPPTPQVLWAFISVTNNDTQHITVISPQR